MSCWRLSQVIGRQAHILASLGAQNNDSQWGSNTLSRRAHILGSLGAQNNDSQWGLNTVHRQANFISSPGANKAKASSFDLLVTTCFTCRVEAFTTSALVQKTVWCLSEKKALQSFEWLKLSVHFATHNPKSSKHLPSELIPPASIPSI